MKRIVLLTFIALVLLCVIPTMALDTGSISVISNPPGAQIWIDENLQDSGADMYTPFVTPHTFDGLSEGWHDVKVYLYGYSLDDPQYLYVTAGQTTTAEFQLVPSKGPSMKVNSSTTNTQTFPGDIITFFIKLSPLDYFGPFPRVMWDLAVLWEPQYLELWDFTDYCGPVPLYGEDYFRCEDAARWGLGDPMEIMFYVLDSTPYRTITTVHFSSDFFDWGGDSKSLDKPFGVLVPEFPSPYIPAIAIVGFLGAVLFIQRTREH